MANKKYELKLIATACPPVPVCPSIYKDKISGDYIIQGDAVQLEEVNGLTSELEKGERLVRIPKSLIDNLRE